MEAMENATSTTNKPSIVPGRWWLVLAAALTVLPIVAYAFQFHFRYLHVPWYLPILATVAALVMVMAVRARRNWGRLLGLGFVGLLAAAEWLFLFVALALPPYTGPIAVGQPFPVFVVVRGDGSVFTQDSFKAPQDTILVFFRGRW